jgi:hypothetical protein
MEEWEECKSHFHFLALIPRFTAKKISKGIFVTQATAKTSIHQLLFERGFHSLFFWQEERPTQVMLYCDIFSVCYTSFKYLQFKMTINVQDCGFIALTGQQIAKRFL